METNKAKSFQLLTNSEFKTLLQEDDIKKINTLTRSSKIFSNRLNTGCLIGVVYFSYFLRKKNIIFQLARRQSIWEFYKKYFLWPQFVASLIETPFEQRYANDVDQILSKYDFQQAEFQDALNAIQKQRKESLSKPIQQDPQQKQQQ